MQMVSLVALEKRMKERIHLSFALREQFAPNFRRDKSSVGVYFL